MKRSMHVFVVVLCILCLPVFRANAQASLDTPAWIAIAFTPPGTSGLTSFLYTNNDRFQNSISAFSVATNGSLTPIGGSPFLTGGTGGGGGLFATNRITTSIVKNFLYASNAGSSNVSAFSIDPTTGVLTPLPGSPFTTGGAGGPGISLATTPDDRFLIATNGGSNNVTVYSIGANGSLSQIAGAPFPIGALGPPDGIKVTPDGKFLAVALVVQKAVAMFSISTTGGLTPVPGSPFPSPSAAGLDCNCASNHLFVGQAGTADKVDVYDILPGGALVPVAGSPFTGPGSNSNVPALSSDDSKLFVSNQVSNTVTVFSVAANGSLSVVPGSPFPVPAGFIPSGMATTQDGTFLYVANINNQVSGFSVAPNGMLTPVPGSPFSNGFPGQAGLSSLTVFPAKNCCPAPVISSASATPAVLSPVNHKFVDVTINYAVTGPCPNSCALSVSSNEPINGTGDGNTSTDWQVTGSHHVLLRSERAGSGNDRIYTITITCTNEMNNAVTVKTVTVIVPHDAGK